LRQRRHAAAILPVVKQQVRRSMNMIFAEHDFPPQSFYWGGICQKVRAGSPYRSFRISAEIIGETVWRSIG
jgi:hypothetical protein